MRGLIHTTVEAVYTIGVRISAACVWRDDELGIVFEARRCSKSTDHVSLYHATSLLKERSFEALTFRKLSQNNVVTQLVVTGVSCP